MKSYFKDIGKLWKQQRLEEMNSPKGRAFIWWAEVDISFLS